MHSAGLLGQRWLLAVPDFSGNLVVLIPGNSGTENDRDSREPGNPHPTRDRQTGIPITVLNSADE